MRKILFWFHLTAGLTAGVVIFIMSLTAVLLMYEKQILVWADGYQVAPPAPGAPVSVEALLAKATAAHPGAVPASVTVPADPARPASVSLGREGTLYMNPYTAEVLGGGNAGARAFFRSVEDWHRWLALQGEKRASGRSLTGAANLLFLFIVLSGPFIWWPKAWTPAAIRSIVLFRSGLQGKARDFNWHNVIGIWSAVPLVFVVATAVVMSYPWANDLLYRITGSEVPPRPAAPSGPAPTGGAPAPLVTPDFTGLDALWAVATKHTPSWQTVSFRVPASLEDPVTFSIDTSTGAQRPDLRSQLVLDRASGSVVRTETYESQNRGRQLRTWSRWVHTGEAFGLFGQTIAGLASAGVLVLAWTGFMLSWRRLRAWRARAATAA
jgi:uncharacterized iron-regulated membrane protein